jgi:hypothetical protein
LRSFVARDWAFFSYFFSFFQPSFPRAALVSYVPLRPLDASFRKTPQGLTMSEKIIPDPVSFIPQNILEEIGRITISFGFLEDELNGLISDLLGAGKKAGQAVTFKIRSITDRIDLARMLVDSKIKIDNHRSDVLASLTEMEAANERRNTLIHHGIRRIAFNVDPNGNLIEFRKKDYLLRETPKDTPFKARELKALRDDLRRIGIDLGKAALRHRVACGHPEREP